MKSLSADWSPFHFDEVLPLQAAIVGDVMTDNYKRHWTSIPYVSISANKPETGYSQHIASIKDDGGTKIIYMHY
jgi:hypothetical protein